MLEKITYINHIGEKIEFGNESTYANANSLRDYMWTYKTSSGTSLVMNREIKEKGLPIVVACDTEFEGMTLKNMLFEVFEKDVLQESPGRLYIGEYYLECYIMGCKKTDYLQSRRMYKAELSILPVYPFWCRERLNHFYASVEQIEKTGYRQGVPNLSEMTELTPDYPRDYKYGYITHYKSAKRRYLRDYQYDYYRNHAVGRLNNDHFAESAFRIIVYGPCTRPEIRVGGNIYKVATTLYDSEYMVIDSRERTIIKYARNGVQENLFNARDKINYIFQRIPPGKITVKWNALYPFDIILYQERSEPLWTI